MRVEDPKATSQPRGQLSMVCCINGEVCCINGEVLLGGGTGDSGILMVIHFTGATALISAVWIGF